MPKLKHDVLITYFKNVVLAIKEEELKGVTAELVATRKQVVKLTGGQTQQPTTQAVAPVRKKPVLTDKGWLVEG